VQLIPLRSPVRSTVLVQRLVRQLFNQQLINALVQLIYGVAYLLWRAQLVQSMFAILADFFDAVQTVTGQYLVV
jgi:hypothetical protein